MTEIPLRQDLTLCLRLEAIAPEQWPQVAEDPDEASPLALELAREGIAPESAASLAIRRAAGDHARQAQLRERGFGAARDLTQTGLNRQVCERLGEVVDLVRRHNAGPQS